MPAPSTVSSFDPGELEWVYQDEALLVLNKPSGLLAVPGRGEDKQDCLARRVQHIFPDALIVHRLDMETSGLMLMARGAEMQRRLNLQFQQRRVEKQYQALVMGRLQHESGIIDLPLLRDWPNRPRQKVDYILGKPSLTHYRVLHYDEKQDTSRVLLHPVTGRSHQIRVHMLSIGHPIRGDRLYAGDTDVSQATRLMLHATSLSLPHPLDQRQMYFESDSPF